MKVAVHRLGWIIKPDVGRLLRRFALPSLAAFAFTLYFLLDLHQDGPLPEMLRVRLPWFLIAGFLWSLAAALIAEERHLSRRGPGRMPAAGWQSLACSSASLIRSSSYQGR